MKTEMYFKRELVAKRINYINHLTAGNMNYLSAKVFVKQLSINCLLNLETKLKMNNVKELEAKHYSNDLQPRGIKSTFELPNRDYNSTWNHQRNELRKDLLKLN